MLCLHLWARHLIVLCFLCLWIALVPPGAGAETNIKPNLLLQQEYTDNFFRSETNEASFWVTRVSPGVQMDYFSDRTRLNLDYAFSYFWYNTEEQDISASKLDYAGHDLFFDASHRFFTRLSLGLTETYILTREAASADRFSNIVEPNKYWRNRVSPFIAYDIAEKGEITLAYRNEQFKWLDQRSGQEDSTENRGIITLAYHLNDRNNLDLVNQVWHREYKGDLSDYTSYQTMLMFRHDFNSYLKGEAGAGFHKRNFDESTVEDWDEPVFHLSLTGDTDLSTLLLTLERNINDFTVGNGYFTAYRADLYAEHVFLEKIPAYVGGYYQYSNYLDSDRKDDSYSGFVGLGYRFLKDIFQVSLEYNLRKRDSNQPGYDYDENRVFLRLDVIYDFAPK